MKAGDLVTVLPYGQRLYLVLDVMQQTASHESYLGSLWELYGEDAGITPMREKWIKMINELD